MTTQVQTADSAAVNRLCLNGVISDQDRLVISKAYPILMALGGLLALGGLFTLLAACQVLPAGANLISGLGLPMKMVSVAAIVGGTVTVVTLLVYYVPKRQKVESLVSEHRVWVRLTRKLWVDTRLQENEVFIVEDSEDKQYYLYFNGRTERCNFSTTLNRENIDQHLRNVTQGKTVVTLEELNNRQSQQV